MSDSVLVADNMAVNHADPHAVDPVGADDIDLVERLVVAPVTGVFFPALTDVSATSPGMVATGDEVGVLVQSGREAPRHQPVHR